MSELELIRLVQNGDQDAYQELLNIHKGLLKNIAHGFRGLKHEKDDIWQLCLLHFWRACMTFDFHKNIMPSTHITNVIKSKLINELKSQNTQSRTKFETISIHTLLGGEDEDFTIEDFLYNPDDQFENALIQELVFEPIVNSFREEAPTKEKMIFEMVYINGLEKKEITELTGLKRDDAYNIERKVKKRLKKIASHYLDTAV